ncbi:MAG: ATP-binding cassette domain-containing protein, partial [Chloroflexota bacterium]
MTAAVEVRNATLGYGSRDVLADTTLVVEPGERVAFVGPNGAGKSTLLRGIAGLLEPRRGDISIDGHRVAELSRDSLARRLAVVPQLAVLPFS